MKKIIAAAMAVSLSVGLAACSQETTDKAKDAAGAVASDAKSGAEKAGDAAKDAAKDGADKAKDAAKDGADAAKDAAKDGAEKVGAMAAGLTKVKDAQGAEVEIPEAVEAEWTKLGGADGELGAITEVTSRNDEDYVVNFNNGDAIIYGKDTGAVVLKGMIGDTWFKDGGFENPIGLPTAEEETLSDGTGWSQKFENGTIQWTNAETGEFHAVVS